MKQDIKQDALSSYWWWIQKCGSQGVFFFFLWLFFLFFVLCCDLFLLCICICCQIPRVSLESLVSIDWKGWRKDGAVFEKGKRYPHCKAFCHRNNPRMDNTDQLITIKEYYDNWKLFGSRGTGTRAWDQIPQKVPSWSPNKSKKWKLSEKVTPRLTCIFHKCRFHRTNCQVIAMVHLKIGNNGKDLYIYIWSFCCFCDVFCLLFFCLLFLVCWCVFIVTYWNILSMCRCVMMSRLF